MISASRTVKQRVTTVLQLIKVIVIADQSFGVVTYLVFIKYGILSRAVGPPVFFLNFDSNIFICMHLLCKSKLVITLRYAFIDL